MLLRNTQLLLRRNNVFRARFQSTNTGPEHQAHDEAIDFRPPWVYAASRMMIFTIVPSIVVYSVFFYDFGDKDHVFRPARRWALKQKAAFLTLSPDEERMLKADKTKSETS
ncbi:hypothetical protein P691DRAFT_770316 [Macrolepiota fuliginosa MF-IS2]|uniref:Uncharacterized protein n=1 Tax=Macrolepiota fuliginosa MF-IS2 TaxID=1400762 RepID=A0A9P6CAA3_9AGAR|nr:hypothetical protein P691DRAFT_770316 [Macrolepiota fuliginosa MF-IS2]